jgi:hypothetical protein
MVHHRNQFSGQNKAQAISIDPCRLLKLQYSDESGRIKHRLVLVSGEEKGTRGFFAFPERLGNDVGLQELHARMGQQVANLLDGLPPEGTDEF